MYNVQDYSVLYNNTWLYIGISLICGKHLHDGIISLRRKTWLHNTSFTSPFCFYWNAWSKLGSEQSCICVLEVSILPLLICDFGTVVFFVFHFIVHRISVFAISLVINGTYFKTSWYFCIIVETGTAYPSWAIRFIPIV